jgi:phosphoglycerol transferase MdoB-like AlkP superfamily enzyme
MPGWHTPAARCTAVLLLMLAFVLLTGLLDGGVGVAPLQLLAQPRFPLANAWPGLLLAGVLLVSTRRALFAFVLAFALQGAVYATNALKVANLGTPLLPADFRIVGQLRRGGMHVLAGYLPQGPWLYLALGAGLVLLLALWRWETPLFPRRTPGKRALSGAALALILGTVLAGSQAWGHIYNGRVLWMEPWSASATSNHSGLISSLLMFHLQFARTQTKPDRLAAQQLIDRFDAQLRHAAPPVTPATPLPDIVVVQSESFFDPRIMRGFEHSELTPNLQRLAAHGSSGQLHVPTFGGGTIRTEFEVLTGLSLRYFDDVHFPYLQINDKQVPGLVRTLNEHGYATMALHGNDPAFWNRTSAFKALGFDRFVSQAAFPANAPNDGKYMADSAMTDEIIAQLKDHGPPQFIFAISIEAHGPYDVEPANRAQRDAIAVPAGITGKDRLELQTYLYHLHRADAELGRLVTYLAQRRRPSLVLFYGDHLPALSDSYRITGFVNGGDMLSQTSVWLLVDPHRQTLPTPATTQATASWLLPGKLLERAGIHDAPYFALTELVGSQLAALTAAPGAPPLPASNHQQQLDDHAMASISQLRLKGKLDSLLLPPQVATHATAISAAQ